MKKTWKIAALLLGIASFGLAGCEKPEDGPGKEPGQEGSGIEKPVDPDAGFTSVGTVKLADLALAVEAFNSAWEEDFTVPSKISVGGKELTIPQYQYAFCKALVNIAAGNRDDINVLSFKGTELSDDDDYDKAEIPVTNGPAVGTQTEDLVNAASRMIAMMRKGLSQRQTRLLLVGITLFHTALNYWLCQWVPTGWILVAEVALIVCGAILLNSRIPPPEKKLQ